MIEGLLFLIETEMIEGLLLLIETEIMRGLLLIETEIMEGLLLTEKEKMIIHMVVPDIEKNIALMNMVELELKEHEIEAEVLIEREDM